MNTLPEMNTLPDFIVIGAMKCGTTSLHHYLRSQPNIYMPLEKEIDFFSDDRNFKKGENWYRSKFNENYRVNGEASPNYAKVHLFPEVPERMHELLPHAKLIYLYRDPVERAYSHYVHSYSSGREQRAPEDVFTEESNFVWTSKYYWQISQFLKFYDRNQILLVDSKELRENREHTLKKMIDFLGLDVRIDSSVLNEEKHASKLKTKRNAFNRKIINTRFGDYLKKITPEKYKIIYRGLTESELEISPLTDQLRDQIYSCLKTDFEKFKMFIKETE